MEYTNYDAVGLGIGALTGGILVFAMMISLLVGIFAIVTMWKIFEKANKPGWACLIPFYNLYVLFEITWGNGLYFLLIFLSIIPILGQLAVLVIIIITYIKLSNAFGKSGVFAIGLILLPIVFMAILAFEKNTNYVGFNSQ